MPTAVIRNNMGKNIVSILLRGAGYTVDDIGNNVETEAIIATGRKEKPDFLALSALLTSTMENMEEVIKSLQDNGLRESVKVIIGGAPVTKEYADSIGADGYGADGFHAVSVVEALKEAN